MRAKYRYNKSQRRLFFFMRLLFCFTDVNVVRVNLQHHVFFFQCSFHENLYNLRLHLDFSQNFSVIFVIYVIFSKALGNPNCMAKRKFK